MKNKERLSHQGLVKVDEKNAEDLKTNFKLDAAAKLGLKRKGYFIGKALLGKMLIENEEAAGILISFGMNKASEKGGNLHLIIEPASGIEADDVPNIIGYLDKYATVKEIGDDDPDSLLPQIKPNPPH